MTIKQKLTALIQQGIRFELSQNKLLVQGDLDALQDADKQFLRANKPAIIALIENQNQTVPAIQKMKADVPKLLSFSQQSLWLLDKINAGSDHYNLSSAFRLKGRLDDQALNKTFLTILQRHESLRSCFEVSASGEPVQRVQAVGQFEVMIETLDAKSENIEAEIRTRVEAEAQRVFDLTKDILLSVRLLKLEEEEHILMVTMHHIASDGWSIGVLMKEFNTLYAAYTQGAENPLPDLDIQYSDYANWQREWLQGKVLEAHKSYWKNQLTDLPVLHNLPLDRPRPVEQTFNGALYHSTIDKKVLSDLKALCQTESASLFMGIHAAFSTLMARYSNEKDIVVGSPIANREKAEIANLVGFFMNLLVLRSDLSDQPSFRKLVQQSKKTLSEAYEHQQMPFEKIVEELQVKRNLSHNPLFQILLTLQNTEQGKFAASDLSMEPVQFQNESAKYDLSLDITESKDGLQLSWEYNTDLFDGTTIASMAEHFNTLLTALLDRPDETVFKVDLIGAQEAQNIYQYLKGEAVNIKDDDHAFVSFENQVKTKANETAVTCNDISYTYQELGKRVDAITQFLLERKVGKGDKVGLCLIRSFDLVASIFACFKIGATYIPLDPVYPAERLNQIINDAEPKCIVTLDALKYLYLNRLPDSQIVCLDQVTASVENEVTAVAYDATDIAYIIFTSGTTGKPKGIEISQGSLSNLLKGFDVSFGSNTQQQWLAQTSINFDISVLELIWTISRGQSIVLQQSNPVKLLTPDRLAATKPLDFSVMFFGADKSTEQKYDLLLETVKFADQNNFSAIWTPERHFGEFGGAFPSPSVLSSALAVLTKQISIRSGSVVLPLHDPVRVAEEWSLIDNLSKGRVGISIASGWQPDDFVFVDADYGNRHQEMRDKVAELKALWKGEAVTRKNGINQDFAIKIRPQPIQEELPIWITAAGSPETFRYAGEIGANLLTHMLGQTLETLANNIAIYQQALRDHGFRLEDKKVSLMLHTYIGESEQMALDLSEQPFKEYLGSSIKLMEPLAKELGIDVDTQKDELIDLAYQRFSKENTLIGSPESCQKMLFNIQEIGVTEVACLIDFGVESKQVLTGLEKIVEAKNLYHAYGDFAKILNADNQKTELDLIKEYQLTHVQMTPSQAKLVFDLQQQKKENGLASVRHWFIGGEALNAEVVKGLSTFTDGRFYNMYGPTETTVWSAWRAINSNDIHIGKPVINTDLLLLNESEQQVPVGVVGELYIGGAGLAKGYYNNEELTAEKFKKISNPYFGNKRFYRTGDLMKLNADGTFDYIGRRDNQVKVNGYRVELEEIEKTIASVVGVKNCKVVPVTNNNSTSLAAYVVKESIVHGDYKELPAEKQARAFSFKDGSTVYHQSDRQLAMLYKEIITDGIYFKHGITIAENGLVLDLGSNIGTFSIDVNRRYPDATVIAFEPIPQIFSGLKKNFEHRQIKGRVLNYGVSNKKEEATFFYYPEMAGMSGRFADKDAIVDAVGQYMEYDKQALKGEDSYLSGEQRKVVESFYDNVDESNDFKKYLSSLYQAEEVECQLTTVSDIIDELEIKAIDLLKLDVEKSECLVMEGIRPEHWPMIRHLAVEVDGDQNLNIILNLLNEKGYVVNVEALALSDANTENEENTYMLYATNNEYGQASNAEALKKLHANVTEPVIQETLKQQLPDYMVPKNITFVPAIPLMENGKADMVKLKQFQPKALAAESVVKLSNKTEMTIYRLWCTVLRREEIPYHVSIFEAGGNSIEMVLLHEKMQSTFNVSFSLVELFRNPTIQQQAKLIQNADRKKDTGTAKKALSKGKERRNARRAVRAK